MGFLIRMEKWDWNVLGREPFNKEITGMFGLRGRKGKWRGVDCRVELAKNRLILSQFHSTLLYSFPSHSIQIDHRSFFLSIKLPLSLSLIFVFFSIFFWDIFISFNVGGKVRKNQRISAVSDLLLDGFYNLCPLSFVYSSEN